MRTFQKLGNGWPRQLVVWVLKAQEGNSIYEQGQKPQRRSPEKAFGPLVASQPDNKLSGASGAVIYQAILSDTCKRNVLAANSPVLSSLNVIGAEHMPLNVLALNIGMAEIVVIVVLGVVVVPILFLPAMSLYYMGHPYQALACGVISLTGVGIIWIAVVAIDEWSRKSRDDGPHEVPE